MGRGEIVTNENNITMKEGTGYAEKTIDVKDGTNELAVETSEGKKAIKVPADNGLYILNLKTDTVIGSLQNIGKDLSNRVMTQEELKVKIDSLEKLTKGANIVSGQNYFIKPNEIGKVSSNVDARIFGPFQKIPGRIEPGEDGKAPEIYKFYTNTEIRETIANLKKLSIYK